MKAGRELDLLIAKEVMCEKMSSDYGQTRDGRWMKEEQVFDSDGTYSRACRLVEWPPCYSESIAVAIQVVDKLPYFVLRRLAPDLWQCQSAWCGDPLDHVTDSCGCVFAEASTAPLAICLAALEWARR